ncbi:MAG: response regulator [Deltaproteobacteria bacterium]|nr:response regulator [Deltaproteobacteria bacterium]
MPGRHIALLVEDEPEMAAELGELLESLGHGHVHTATKEDAERLVEAGEFCYVLLDLQIKVNADSIKAHVEAGQSLLEFIRERYPQRNEHDKYRLPILVMSGHAKEHYYVVKALQDGADDFITKPVGECKPPFKDKIQDALRRSGREKHERCAAVMREARASASAAASGNGAPDPCLPMTITGRIEGKRAEIKICGHVVLLTTGSLIILLHLVAGHVRGGDGWVHKNDLGAKTEQGWKGVSRLRDELRPGMPKKADFFENDKSGSYRLHGAIRIDAIDLPALESHWDARVKRLAAEIRCCQEAAAPAAQRPRRS